MQGVPRCPHCGVANPLFTSRWLSEHVQPEGSNYGRYWGTYECSSCTCFILAEGYLGNEYEAEIASIYPNIVSVATDLPEQAQRFLTQAYETLHSPDGSAMLSGAAVDSMLKSKGLTEGSVYARIEKASETGILTNEMAEWAHEVRLGSNRPRHADLENPHVSHDEAKQAYDFAVMLGHILFVLPAKVQRGKKQAMSE